MREQAARRASQGGERGSQAKILLDFKAEQAGHPLAECWTATSGPQCAVGPHRGSSRAGGVQPLIMQWPEIERGAAQPLVITLRLTCAGSQQVDPVPQRVSAVARRSQWLRQIESAADVACWSPRRQLSHQWQMAASIRLSLIARDLSQPSLLTVAPTLAESDARTRLAGSSLRGDRALTPLSWSEWGEVKLGLLMVLAQLPDLLLLDEPGQPSGSPRVSCSLRSGGLPRLCYWFLTIRLRCRVGLVRN
nr:ABC transporter, ATP-binding protein [Escherichia coli]